MLVLDDDLVEPLREGIRERYGFAATVDHLALFGLCAYCRTQGAEDREQRAEE
jgi:Fur family ferric uptake transcriptional regulator